MTLRSLFRHLASLVILSSIFINEVGWQNTLIWARLNQRNLLLWLFGLFVLILVNFLVYLKVSFKPNGLPRLFFLWLNCPKCRAFWLGALFSAIWHGLLWNFWLTWLFFALWGGSFCSFFTILLHFFYWKKSQF